MAWRGSTRAGTRAHILTVAAFLGLFGFSPGTAEQTEREEWYGSVDCPATLFIRWNEYLSRPPYVEKEPNSTGVFRGLFRDFLEMMLVECCRLSTTLAHNSSDVKKADLEFPVVVNLGADCNMKKHNSNLVPLVPHTGVTFVVVKGGKSNHSLQMVKSLFTTWPVLVLTLVLSLFAGMIAWSLENRKNSDDFPQTFTKGTWEGFWWAFISMTTVGYGDCCPRTVGGRLFAIIWILMGICVCSIFTAALTSSLTTLSLETKMKLPGTKVVALLDSIESSTGFRNQANLTRVKTSHDIHRELQSGRVQGALMDAYLLVYFKQNYPTTELNVQEIIQQSELEYGARVKNIELANCFREKRYTMESNLFEMAEGYLTQSLSSGLEGGGREESNLFDPEGMLFFPTLFTCLGVTAVLVIAGVAWDLWKKFHYNLSKKGTSHGISIMLTEMSSLRERSSRGKCYITQEKLKELENKIQDVNQVLNLIKDDMKCNKRERKFNRV